ncbi:MAG: secretin N-terminal domain-containing protein, partial [Alphaproteobacteria bacterium]|nr:secretin N-terminal domain-containing protein [Alphaproteobacteria bacterium]
MTREDFLALRNRRNPENAPPGKRNGVPPIPKMPQMDGSVAIEPLDKLVSVNITDSVPIREVLMELVRKTGANLELDPHVQGSVILSAKDQPFEHVLKRICALAKLRYTVEGSFIHIEPDEPYQKSYRLNYLSLVRRTSSDTSISTNVFDVDIGTDGTGNSSSSSRSSTAAENNSTSKVSGVSEADFWAETKKSLEQILGAGSGKQEGKPSFSLNKQAG